MEVIEKDKYEKLIRKSLRTNGFFYSNKEYEDVYQEAWLGLCKSVNNHKVKNNNEEDNWYYYKQYVDGYIKNYKKGLQEIKVFTNKEGNIYTNSCISLQQEVFTEDEHPIYLEDIVGKWDKEELDLSETINDKFLLKVCELLMEGYTQCEVAEKLNISQSKVCLLLKTLKDNNELYEQLKDRLQVISK